MVVLFTILELATNEQRVGSASPPDLSPVKQPGAANLEVPLDNGLMSNSSEGTPTPSDDEPVRYMCSSTSHVCASNRRPIVPWG